jgi:phospho-N-acetylmuramoyl-pentapeptide-transferase
MFYGLLHHFFPHLATHSLLKVFAYTSVRAACALVMAFVLSLILGPKAIRRLTELRFGQQVRNFTTADTAQFNIHQHKAGTPTMGGLLIVGTTLISVLLFCSLRNSYVWITIGMMLGTAALGFADDMLKIQCKNHKGVSGKTKLLVQTLLGLGVGLFLYVGHSHTNYAYLGVQSDTHLLVPFFKNLYPALGFLIVPWAVLVVASASNAVNLTDGLDGLAIGTTIIVGLPYLALAYIVSRYDYSAYLIVPHVPQAGDLGVFLSAIVGAGMGFMWFNAHPAEVFMGDTGSLSLGAVIGTIALLCKQELLLVLMGGVFVIEALSVMLQVGFYKWRGRRILLMSPLHNHFVRKGVDESKIIARFMIVSTLLALVGLSTLKLR